MSKTPEKQPENTQKESNEGTNWEEIAMSLAKELVQLAQDTRVILSNSTFNFNVIDQVKLVEMSTREILDTYTQQEEENGKEESNQKEG